jgi:hypothetical protein
MRDLVHSKRTPIIVGCMLGALVLCAALGVALYAGSIGWPARPIINPPADLCGLPHAQIQSALVYELPTLVDRHTLCRLTPNVGFEWPDAAGLGLAEVPQEFWSQPPYWWQPRRSAEAKFFMTSGFMADTRGPDGLYSLSMYDKAKNEIYIWFKYNF